MGFVDTMKSGEWLTAARIRDYSLILAGLTVVAVAALVATSNGMVDFQGRPLGTDFSNVWSAGRMVLDGHPAAPFDPMLHRAEQQAIFADPDIGFYGWHYPPFFLFVAGALASMPYLLALAVWQGVTLALYLWAMWGIVAACRSPYLPLAGGGMGVRGMGLWLLLALAYPAVFVNLGHGHNGFLTAALMGGGLVLIDRRPWIAGGLFGLLAYKPQFGLMIPLVLVLTGRWRTVAAAAATVLVLAGAATLAFGVDVWSAFLEGTRFTRMVVLEAGETGWHKIQSVFALVRMWGGPVPLAYAVQAAVTVVVAGALAWLWRSPADAALKAAALPLAAVLGTPYSLDYDLMVLAPAIAFLGVHGLTRGFGPCERTALAFAWFVPLIARSAAQATLVPLGVLAMLALFGLIVRRAVVEAGGWHWRTAARALR